MAPPQVQTQPPTSHKRASSGAGNSMDELPESKTKAPNHPDPASSTTVKNSHAPLQKVHVLESESRPMYDDNNSDSLGIYSTLEDANNALRADVDDNFGSGECSKHGTRADGTLWWSCGDVGEGDAEKLSVKIWKVKPPGSVPKSTEWNGGRNVGQGQVTDADWSAGEEDGE